jgi:hypothetical protein
MVADTSIGVASDWIWFLELLKRPSLDVVLAQYVASVIENSAFTTSPASPIISLNNEAARRGVGEIEVGETRS